MSGGNGGSDHMTLFILHIALSKFLRNSIKSKTELQTVFFLMHPALELNDFTSHQLRLIQQVLRKHFKDLIYIRITNEDASQRKLIVFADSEDEKHLIMVRKQILN